MALLEDFFAKQKIDRFFLKKNELVFKKNAH